MFQNKVTTLLFVFICGLGFAQLTESDVREIARTQSEQDIVRENSRMMQDGFIYFADILADRLLEFDPNRSNYNYRKGFTTLKLNNDYKKALLHFLVAVRDTDPNYDAYSQNEKSAPTDAYFHLASCYHLNEEIDAAIENYSKFLEATKKNSELIPQANLNIIQCQVAKSNMANPVNVQLKNVGDRVNSKFPEYSSVVSLDGSSLYFTSKRAWSKNESDDFKDLGTNQFPEDIYVSVLDEDSNWTRPFLLEFCKPGRNEGTMGISINERRLYLYQDSTGSGDIYFSDFYTGKFNEIVQLNDNQVNTKYWETHAMVSPDGSLLLFVSDRPGGYGGRDIYVCTRNADSTWSKPSNLGPKVNSTHDEDAPFVSIDNQRLYFSSNGEKSMGGFDILVSDLLSDGSWSESRNLGYPFNSTNDDIFYTTTIDGLKGYMTSNRNGGMGEKDLYEIQNDFLGVKSVAVFKGKIKTSDGSPLPEDFAINFKLSCDDCEDSEDTKVIFPRLKDGMFMTGLKPCKTFRIAYINASDKKIMHEETFATDCNLAYQEVYRELILDVPTRSIIIPKDTVVEIEPVDVATWKNVEFMHYFDYNKNKLAMAKGDLKRFVKEVEEQLKAGRPKITINVYSSASNVPTKTFESNEKLTAIRAENMKYDLSTYFESSTEFKGKVNVVIVSAVVDGPAYDNDFRNRGKYKPYQFVGLKTE